MLCVQWFRKAYPHVLAFHVPNGEKRDRRTAEKLQRMGVLPGVPDWLMFPRGLPKIAIEFKSKKGSQTLEQTTFNKEWDGGRGEGVMYIVRTLVGFQNVCYDHVGPPFLFSPNMPWN